MTIYENPYITNYVAAQAFLAESAWKEPVTIGILSLLLLKIFGVETRECELKIFGSVVAADFIYNKYKTERAPLY